MIRSIRRWFERSTRPPAPPQFRAGGERKVLEVVFDPLCHSRGGRRLIQVCGFNDPAALSAAYARDLSLVSGGFLGYVTVDRLWVDGLPRKLDGFQYDEREYLACFSAGSGWHQPDQADYLSILRQTEAVRRVSSGEIDELWLWGPPYAGFWESSMVGRGAYFCNSDPIELPECGRRFVVMGFNYERGVGEMLESFGHRVESELAHAFGSWREWGGRENHPWDQFTAYDLVSPGQAGCGTVHFAPNSRRDYDWGNPFPVWSSCDSWPAYPATFSSRRQVDCREWGGGDIRAHHKWWLGHLPRSDGERYGIRNNWWTYLT